MRRDDQRRLRWLREDPVTQTPLAPVPAGAPDTSATHHRSRPHGFGTRPTPHRTRLGAYVALTKPRIIELLLVTTLPSMVLAADGLPSWWVALVTMLGGTLAAGSANALNCYLDRDIDAIMRRTGRRPLARHEVSAPGALVFGLVLGAASVLAIGLATNWLAGALTLAAIAFYVLVYTMLLKRRTSQNIVWGGIAGCMPVLIGWAAVTGSLAAAPFALFAVVFFWTPPHTWALATRYRDDYARAGVPMLPVVAPPTRVAVEIVVYSWLTVAASLVLWPLATGWVYGVLASAAGAVLLIAAHRLLHQTRRGGAVSQSMQFFHLSNSYLAFVFVAVAVDTFLR
ncbi:MAG TPA: heme o synthase [Jatrophihabitantaceae bacterium]|jgi:protoheme IX farnesyltransferase